MNNPKNAIIFGAGASYGHLPTNVPALGCCLIDGLIEFSSCPEYQKEFSSIGENSQSLDKVLGKDSIKLFRKDFELGMRQLIDKDKGDSKLLSTFEVIMAGYFSQFTNNISHSNIDIQKSLYSDLARKLLEIKNSDIFKNTILISLNYDLLLEKYFWATPDQFDGRIRLKYSFQDFQIVEQEQDHPLLHLIKPHGSINFTSSIIDSSETPLNNEYTPTSILNLRAINYQGYSLKDAVHSNLLMAAYTDGKPISEHRLCFEQLRSDTIEAIKSLSSISFIGVRMHELNLSRDPFLRELINTISKNCITTYIGDDKSFQYLSKGREEAADHLGIIWEDEHNNNIVKNLC